MSFCSKNLVSGLSFCLVFVKTDVFFGCAGGTTFSQLFNGGASCDNWRIFQLIVSICLRNIDIVIVTRNYTAVAEGNIEGISSEVVRKFEEIHKRERNEMKVFPLKKC